MCGIAGKLWFDGSRPADRGTVAAMTAALAHRGPDGTGLAVDGPLALGHRRLAIVDLSPRGAQPMASADGRCLLVANGEIYNHRALRRELEAAGHRFASACDSEVILPLYLEHFEREGPAFVQRLDGMFAFALWDGRARRLLLARDRVGQKPLLYALRPDGLSFASELPALGRDREVDRTPDDRALADYLAFRCVPWPRTAWRGASKLPPAGVLVVEGGGRARLERTWRPVPGPEVAPAPGAPTLDEAAVEVGRLLDAAVRKRLMADVPLGAFLSGGLDSAAVVAAMAAGGAGRVRTYTIGFEDPAYDETPEARRVARLLGSEHVEHLVAPDALSLLERVLAHHGEPFADASAIPTFLVSELAARDVKVVLTGDGGDEAFAGYDRYRALALAQRLRHPAAGPLRGALAGAAALVRGAGWVGGQRSRSARLLRFAEAVAAPPRRANHLWRLATPPGLATSLLSAEGRRRLFPPGSYGPDLPGALPLNEALTLDVEHYLPDDLLVKLDVASMAHGLEARSPFLDRELLTYAASLPARLKLGRPGSRSASAKGAAHAGPATIPLGATSKLVLRHALRRRLPADVLSGPKRGFGVPLDAWLRGPLLGHAREVLLAPAAARRGLLDGAAVGRLLEDHAAGRVAAHETLYTLLVLERWFQTEESPA